MRLFVLSSAEYSRRNRAKGLCSVCTDPAMEGHARCRFHLYKNKEAAAKYKKKHREKVAEYNRKKKARYILEGKCPFCGSLKSEMDTGYACENCKILKRARES